MLNQVGKQNVVVPIGDRTHEFKGMIKLNHTASFIWKCLQEEITQEELTAVFQGEYGISQDQAERDIQLILDILSQHNLLED